MHIEPTSRCTLSCPACARTWFSENFNRAFPKQDLDLDHLEKFLDCDSGQSVRSFLINGNHGDPIYYPRLLELIQRFRHSKFYKISTNGSYQTQKFWTELRGLLTDQDTVYFSLDGLEHNNHLYRKNSNWESIVQAIDIMRQSPARLVCKTLVFSYNEQELDQIQNFAASKNMQFVCETTARYGNDSLKPSENLIDTSRLYSNTVDTTHLEPQCFDQEYVSADGYYWPCCLITSYHTLHQTTLWKQRNLWAIKSQTLDQARTQLKQWYQNIIDAPEQAHSVCKMNCKPGQSFKWPKF